MANRKLPQLIATGDSMASRAARAWITAAIVLLIGAMGWWLSLSIAQAQEPPSHVYSGTAHVDGKRAPDGTTITAWIEGDLVGKTTAEGGKYTLSVQQPPGQSYAGRNVVYRVGGVQSGEIRDWVPGGTTVVELNAYPGYAGNTVEDRHIRTCVQIALERELTGRDDLSRQELAIALELCPALEGHRDALESGGSGGGSLQDTLACVAKVLGRMPLGPQDMTGQERLKVVQACPELINNLDDLIALDQNGGQSQSQSQSQTRVLEQELRQIEEELRHMDQEGRREIQQELDQLDRDRSDLERQLWDDLQQQLNQMDQERFDVERQWEREIRNTSDSRVHRAAQNKYQQLLSSIERERFEVERRTQTQIEQKLNGLDRQRQDRERQFWDEYQRDFNELEQRRFDLESGLERQRSEEERLRREQDDRQRFAREREQEEARFRDQEARDRQRIERERLSMEGERQREEERFRLQEESDRRRFDEELRRQQESQRRDQGFGQQNFDRPGEPGGVDGGRKSPRGFFTNSVSGSVSDVDKFMDPTTLAVFGILLTLVATSLSLFKGN